MDDRTRITRWVKRMHAMKQAWEKNESHWRDIAEYMLSKTHGPMFEDQDKAKSSRPEKTYDTTGVESLRVLASGMQGGLTSPSRPWFTLGLVDDALGNSEQAQAWLRDTQERLSNTLQRSNFYDQMHRAYYELGAFGNGVILIEEDADALVWFQTLNVGHYYMMVNEKGVVDTLYRELKLTTPQLMERWPDSVPEAIKSQYDSDNLNAQYTVLHAIEPRRDYDHTKKDKLNRPYLSAYVLLDCDQVLLEEGGYFEKPFIAARWGANYEDTYGYGPASDVLPAVKTLQQTCKALLKGLQKEIDPPLNVHSSLKNSINRIGTTPNFINFVDYTGTRPPIEPLSQVSVNFAQAYPQMEHYQRQIRQGLFYDLFLMISDTDKRMTATEVAERNAEKMLLLGPTLERLRSELFQPLINRVFAIMLRQGKIDDPPEEIAGGNMQIEFVSMLAQAQKAAGVTSIQRLLEIVFGVAQAKPEVLDKLDADKLADTLESMLGVDPGIIRGTEEADKIRQAKARQQQQLMQQQQAMAAGQMAMQGMQAGGALMKDAAQAGLPVADMLGQAMGGMSGGQT